MAAPTAFVLTGQEQQVLLPEEEEEMKFTEINLKTWAVLLAIPIYLWGRKESRKDSPPYTRELTVQLSECGTCMGNEYCFKTAQKWRPRQDEAYEHSLMPITLKVAGGLEIAAPPLPAGPREDEGANSVSAPWGSGRNSGILAAQRQESGWPHRSFSTGGADSSGDAAFSPRLFFQHRHTGPGRIPHPPLSPRLVSAPGWRPFSTCPGGGARGDEGGLQGKGRVRGHCAGQEVVEPVVGIAGGRGDQEREKPGPERRGGAGAGAGAAAGRGGGCRGAGLGQGLQVRRADQRHPLQTRSVKRRPGPSASSGSGWTSQG
ncbi:uncharacterized protein LOC115837045 [Nomascus leucogenys]|uniref:uncharacterized protein LOC115837045 n=1 Tax=Nomascus leucogenys TaxID=61853 RepID=UPI00122D9A9B|nr:uncharacterized protein LOC115837045 [Nomascus leucogenys]